MNAEIQFVNFIYMGPFLAPMRSPEARHLAEKIAGEIVLSSNPGETLRKWRVIFRLKQADVAGYLHTSASVISDYEGGRRKSPGITTIRNIVEAMIALDEERGGGTIRKYSSFGHSDAIIDIREFPRTVSLSEFLSIIKGELLNESRIDLAGRDIHGYTFLDSLKAIVEFDSSDYSRIYGMSTARALVFTGVYYGRSPMVAIRVHPLKPGAVVYHAPHRVDSLAVKLADMEGIPLMRTNLDIEEIVKRMAMV